MEDKRGQHGKTSDTSTSDGSLQLPEGPAIAFRNLKNAKVRTIKLNKDNHEFYITKFYEIIVFINVFDDKPKLGLQFFSYWQWILAEVSQR